MVAQLVKNPPATQETRVPSLGCEDPLEEGMATHSSILAWRIPIDRGAWQATIHGVAESDPSEQLSRHHGEIPTENLVVVVQSLSRVWLCDPWTTERQASLPFTIARSLLKLMPIKSVMPSHHLILCCPLLLPPPVFPSGKPGEQN